jgi:hypothetical protein
MWPILSRGRIVAVFNRTGSRNLTIVNVVNGEHRVGSRNASDRGGW